jgi:Fe-S-cluster containining protein
VQQNKDNEFVLQNEYTGHQSIVTVDPDKHEFFLDQSIFEIHPDSCPFFRFRENDKKGYCTCHLTRPPICRDYNCWRILIQNSTGSRVGRVMGWRHLCAEDEHVKTIWSKHAQELSSLPDEEWDRSVVRLFQSYGYRIVV